jgi:hypothetical protein
MRSVIVMKDGDCKQIVSALRKYRSYASNPDEEEVDALIAALEARLAEPDPVGGRPMTTHKLPGGAATDAEEMEEGMNKDLDKAFGDAVYDAWRNGGNPDHVDADRIDEDLYYHDRDDAVEREVQRVIREAKR